MKLLEKLLNAKKFSDYQLKDDQGVSPKYTDAYYDVNNNKYYIVYSPFWYVIALFTMPIMIILWIYSKLNPKFKLYHLAYKSKGIKYKGQVYHIFYPSFNMLINVQSLNIVHWSTVVTNKSLKQRYKEYIENPEKVTLLKVTYQDLDSVKVVYGYNYLDIEMNVHLPNVLNVQSITFNTKVELKASGIKNIFKYYDPKTKEFYS